MVKVIAITGASGSGKSTLAAALVNRCNRNDSQEAASLINQDAYYRDLSHMSKDARDAVDFDRPEAVEFELLAAHLQALREGREVDIPCYDFTRHVRMANARQTVSAAPLVVIEGVLVGAWHGLWTAADVVVFVEAPLELCLERRITRDARERGRNEASVRDFWQSRALPAYLTWANRVRSHADLVVSGTQPPDKAVDEILYHLGR